MSDESSTFNVFASKNGYSVHFKISVADVKHAEDEPAFMALLKAAEWLLRDMKEKGYEHDTSKDRPAFGGRKATPDAPPPTDIPVPQHCGEPMKYVPKATRADGTPISAKYECRKGAECENPREYNGKKYGATKWEDTYRRELAEA